MYDSDDKIGSDVDEKIEVDSQDAINAPLAHLTRQTPPELPLRGNIPLDGDAPPPSYNNNTSVGASSYINMDKQISIDQDIRDKIAGSLTQVETNSTSDSDTSDEEELTMEDVYTNIDKMIRRDGEMGVILPLRASILESYLSPLLMIFSQVPKFSNLMLKHEYLKFPYKPNWWNREQCSIDLPLIQEIERLVAFLRDDSNRAFASLYNLIHSINKLNDKEIETINEFLAFSLNQVSLFLGSINGDYQATFDSMFRMVCVPDDDIDQEHQIFAIPIVQENITSNVHDTIGNRLVEREREHYGEVTRRIYFKTLPDIVNVVFEPGMNIPSSGMNIEEKLYLQMYTLENKDILTSYDDEIRQIKARQRELTQKQFKMSAFSGKSVRKFLDDARRHLSTESTRIGIEESSLMDGEVEFPVKDKYLGAAQNIEIIADSIKKSLKEIESEFRALNAKLVELRDNQFSLDKVSQERKDTFEAHILTGVIVSSTQFFLRSRKTGGWKAIVIDDETCKMYKVFDITFEEILEIINEYVQDGFSDGLVLTYVEEDVFAQGEFEPLNNSLKEFIKKDNAKLKEQVEFINSGGD